ncbi:cobalt-precorrin-6A synthase [bacterium BMS3Abin09]|nr:cobalt-precorrin-6A synthase [bacterium BMS3Abin09]GBE40632.1 cobalt-precorrin-6A synthase [bacterium BMS3Bbin09]HDH34966.1 cobalamin biosynthesis protein CbiD [Nitrospirota bacterium]HDN95068.1 cobalamin biosynthesis protein CbiD [Nitrospirota bacterium]
MKNKELRSGYTTGACAAAAAKAAVMLLSKKEAKMTTIDIPFPDGSRVKFRIHGSGVTGLTAWASVIKDGGDDPDITHGAEIMAKANVGARHAVPVQIIIKGGKGVGVVTKPGLPVSIGEPAINPVPMKMIEEAVKESAKAQKCKSAIGKKFHTIEITISVPKGEELAKKTLNSRLGITGGISILGTTGIVKPVSTEAWKATIASSMDVARAMGNKEVVLSAGRTSEKAHMKKYNLPEERYVLMGDHLEYSLKEAKRHGFKRAHLCAQWAKMLKIAMATPQTHVRFGAIDTKKAAGFLNSLSINVPQEREFNTAREIFDHIIEKNPGARCDLLLQKVCNVAKGYAEETGKIPVTTNLVSYDGKVIVTCE